MIKNQAKIQVHEDPNPLIKQTDVNNEKSNRFQAFNNILKGAVGAGVLGLPYVVYESGLVFSLVLFIPLGYMAYYSAYLLVQIAEDLKKQDLTPDDIYLLVKGPVYSKIYNFVTFFYQFGLLVAYTIFFIELFQQGFLAIDIHIPKIFFFLMSLIIIIPMSLTRNYHQFQAYAIVGNIFMISPFLITFFYDIYLLSVQKFHHKNLFFGKTEKLFSFVGVSILSFLYINNTLFIRRSIKDPKQLDQLMRYGMIVIYIFYSSVSLFTNIGLNHKPNEIFLFSYVYYSPYFHIGNVIFGINLVITFGIQFYAATYILELIPQIKKITQRDGFFYKNVSRFGLVIVVMSITYIAPQFHVVLSIVGNISGVTISYILPIISYNFHFRNQISQKKKIVHQIIMVLGIIGGILGLTNTIVEVYKDYFTQN